MGLAKPYLLCYNLALALAWSCVLYQACGSLLTSGPAATYAATHTVLSYAQSAAVLEVVHAFVGLVRSPWPVTAVQVGSRVGVLWGVLWIVPEVRTQQLRLGTSIPLPWGGSFEPALDVAVLVVAWSVSEIIRYTFYFCKECGYVPGLVLWLRYSGFMVLYPLGVGGELSVVYMALPYLHQRKLYSVEMPNALNFAFSVKDLFRLVSLAYLFGLPMLYGYMLEQRRRNLAPRPAVGKAKKRS